VQMRMIHEITYCVPPVRRLQVGIQHSAYGGDGNTWLCELAATSRVCHDLELTCDPAQGFADVGRIPGGRASRLSEASNIVKSGRVYAEVSEGG
jgi:hypothetical protein